MTQISANKLMKELHNYENKVSSADEFLCMCCECSFPFNNSQMRRTVESIREIIRKLEEDEENEIMG